MSRLKNFCFLGTTSTSWTNSTSSIGATSTTSLIFESEDEVSCSLASSSPINECPKNVSPSRFSHCQQCCDKLSSLEALFIYYFSMKTRFENTSTQHKSETTIFSNTSQQQKAFDWRSKFHCFFETVKIY